MIIRKIPWATKPPQGTRLSNRSGVTRPKYAWAFNGTLAEHTSGKGPTTITGTVQNTQQGIYIASVGGTDGLTYANPSTPWTEELTMLAWVRPNFPTATTASPAICRLFKAGNGHHLSYNAASDDYRFLIDGIATGNSATATYNDSFQDNLICLAGTYKNGVGGSLWKDGQWAADITNGDTLGTLDAWTPIYIGTYLPGSGFSWGGWIYEVYVFDKALSAAEIAEAYRDRYRWWEPRTVYVPTYTAPATTNGLIARKIPWTSKPPQGTRLANRAGVTRPKYAWAFNGTLTEVATGAQPTSKITSSGATITAQGLYFPTAATTDGFQYSAPTPAGDQTILVWARADFSTATTDSPRIFRADTLNTSIFYLASSDDYRYDHDATTTLQTVATIDSSRQYETVCHAITYSQTDGVIGYQNGQVVSSTAANGPADAITNFTVGQGRLSVQSLSWNGWIYEVYIFDKALTAAEIAEAYRDRYRWWEPRTQYIPVSAGATGPTYTLTASSGTYSYTGNAAALTAARKLTAAQGTYSYTGNAAGLVAGRKLLASSGTYSSTGYDAAFQAARKLAAASGTYAIVGNAANLKASRNLLAQAGTYSYTGYDAALKAARKLAATSGTYSYTGYDATLTYTPVGTTYTLTASPGTYSYTGNAAGLKAARILTAEAGTFTYTGYDATLTYPYIAPTSDSGGGSSARKNALDPKMLARRREREDMNDIIRIFTEALNRWEP